MQNNSPDIHEQVINDDVMISDQRKVESPDIDVYDQQDLRTEIPHQKNEPILTANMFHKLDLMIVKDRRNDRPLS